MTGIPAKPPVVSDDLQQAIMLKLTADQDYLAYGRCFSKGRFQEAIEHLYKVIERARVVGDPLEVGMLISFVASTQLFMGSVETALETFEEADRASGGDAAGRYATARQLYEFGHRPDLALKWLERIIERHDHVLSQGNTAVVHQTDIIRAARLSIIELNAEIAAQGDVPPVV